MALVENFDSYNDGDLNGQGDWSGDTNFDVQGTVKQAGTKAVSIVCNASDKNIRKTFTEEADGNQIMYVRMSATNAYLEFHVNDGARENGSFMRIGGGDIAYVNGDPAVVNMLSDYSINTWYKLEQEWRDSDKKARFRIDDGTWTDWDTTRTTWTSMDTIWLRMSNTGGSTVYFDSLSDPNYVPTDTCTCPTGDWYINSSDNCYLSANCDLDTGKLFLLNTGEGAFNIIDSAELSITGLESTSTDINVKAGGKINFK